MEDIDFPPVTPGVQVFIQLRESGGREIKSPVVVLTVKDSDTCYDDDWADEWYTTAEAMHKRSICPECISDWAHDWYITLGDTPADLGIVI